METRWKVMVSDGGELVETRCRLDRIVAGGDRLQQRQAIAHSKRNNLATNLNNYLNEHVKLTFDKHLRFCEQFKRINLDRIGTKLKSIHWGTSPKVRFSSANKLHYVGPHPPPQTYGLERMSGDGKWEFETWYETVRHAFTPAYGRLTLYSYLQQLQDRVLYFDTDSLIYVSKEDNCVIRAENKSSSAMLHSEDL
ncbi:hypothetical protein F2P81_011815 [Scophthalmus maximus]|uniref:Uncharacterized protein n=1 Tax=Scophthalmus maximus TaxID=52904 RepID=A0A6A4SR83_SCOMX|nr:hypothetical protein F2P81_011815 [Scophthalmus maximus]